MCIFLFGSFHFSFCILTVERLVDNIVEELGLVGVDVVACVGNHLQLDPDPENRCQGDCHAGGQGEAQCTEHIIFWVQLISIAVTILASDLFSEFLNQLLTLMQHS